ncbi:NAD-dependent epimerase/dehydratase family protein [Lihuaxuella thermophila]|nr:NAD-dependent epimerase/dehydratase family protein [Lihuaxuella thermophila]
MVVGGAGFIGSHVVDAYIQEGHEVIVVDNFSTGKRENVNKEARVYELDIWSDTEQLESVFRAEQPEIVNHHAVQKSVPESVKNPVFDAKINILGTLHLLDLSVKYNVQKFIFISSGGALTGEADHIPTTEEMDPQLISPYAISKYTIEKYLHFYHITFGLNYTVLRYANVYGPRQAGGGECGVTPIFMNNLLNDQPSVLFAYSDMPKGTTRDYVYVEDVATANVLSISKGDHSIINIGTGKEVFTEDLYCLAQSIIGKNIPLIREKERTGDVKRSALDCSRAEKLLGWKANTPLNEGLVKTFISMRTASGQQTQ